MDTSSIVAIIVFVVVSVLVIGLIMFLSRKKQPTGSDTIPTTPKDTKDDIKVTSIFDNREINIKEEKEEKVVEKEEEPVLEDKVEEKEEEIPRKKIEPKKREIEPIKEEINYEVPSIDVPINNMDDSPITVEEVSSLVNEEKEESIKIEESKPVEEKIEDDEIIQIESGKAVEEEKGEEAVVFETPKVEVKEEKEEVKEEAQTTIIEPDTITEVKEEPSNAFSQKPSEDHEINTNFKVEEVRTYDNNKTEIYNLDEIKKAMGKE